MSDKTIDYQLCAVPRLTLADLDRYIPIVEHAVLSGKEQLTRHLVITSAQLRFEQNARLTGLERLCRLIDGINSSRSPYQYRDGTHPVEDIQQGVLRFEPVRPCPSKRHLENFWTGLPGLATDT